MKITIINTGGTFNKTYNPISGSLEIQKNNLIIEKVVKSINGNIDFEIIGTIFKDSLEFTKKDRKTILEIVQKCNNRNIIIIHGTDTINLSAEYLENRISDKKIIFVGAMKPISINPFDGLLNFGIAVGSFQNLNNGIYISMSGLCVNHNKITKNRKVGKFVTKN